MPYSPHLHHGMLSRFFCLPFLLLLAPLAEAQARVFVSLAGTLLEADITAVNGDSVTLKRASDGQSMTVNQTGLCKEDRDYIARWVQANASAGAMPAAEAAPGPPPAAGGAFQKYSLAVQGLPAKNNRAPAGSTLRVFETTYTFHISNKEVARDLQGAKAVILTLGKNAADAADVIVLQKLQFDLTVRAQSKTTLTTPPVQLMYSAEFRYGVRGLGYVIFILDAQGNILLAESSPVGNEGRWKEASAIDQCPCLVDRDFKLRPGIDAVLSYIRF